MQETAISCPFCNILEGKIPGFIVAENNLATCILSLEGHPLVIPKRHITDYLDPSLDSKTIQELALLEAKIVLLTSRIYGVKDIAMLSLNGTGAGQEVSHLHKHIIPVISGPRIISIRRTPNLDNSKLSEIAAKFKEMV
ncbi:MAG: HIT family protein [Microgenomates group bacterium]|jgi:histidine triad (HIT) family protein